MTRPFPAVLAALAAALPAPAALAQAPEPDPEPTLVGRAILPAETTAPAPFTGAPDTDPAPAEGATQPVGGFSALIPAGGRTYWAMPDNGFGSKANSRSFLLRVYRVRPRFRTETGGRGTVDVLDSITLSDPDRRVPFPIVTEGTPERLLTGGDFDIESVRVDASGDLWFGEEFGPFLLHTDATGRVLEAPVRLPGVSSPDDPLLPAGQAANLPRSRGFEGMAISPNGRYLLPVLDLLRIRDPFGLSLPAREGDVGIGDPFAFPYQTIESVLPVGGDRLALVNDTNFGSRGRNPNRPDDSDFIVVDVPDLDP